jgi:hypothetical protein
MKKKPRKPNIKKGEVRNPKGRGAAKFKLDMSFEEAINKAITNKKV